MPAVKSQPISIVNARVSYPNIWRKNSYDKYTVNLILDENTKIRYKEKGKWITLSQEKMLKLAYKKCSELFGGKKVTRDSFDFDMFFLKSGDKMSAKADDPKPEYEGHEILCAAAWDRPMILDKERNKLTSQEDDEIYAGCRVNASVHIQPWKNTDKKTKGCRAVLRAVQFNGDDESFGAPPADADEEFDDVSGDDEFDTEDEL